MTKCKLNKPKTGVHKVNWHRQSLKRRTTEWLDNFRSILTDSTRNINKDKWFKKARSLKTPKVEDTIWRKQKFVDLEYEARRRAAHLVMDELRQWYLVLVLCGYLQAKENAQEAVDQGLQVILIT